MQENKWVIAINEFLHVGLALVAIIAIVSIITGIIREYIPQEKLQKKLSKHEKCGPIIGALLGILTPFCSASMVPVVMGMVEVGASMGTIFGFLISAPLCNFAVVGLILATFGVKVATIYLILTLGGAILAGYIIRITPLKHEIRRNITNKTTCCSANMNTCSNTSIQPLSSCSCGQPQKTCATHYSRVVAAMPFAWTLFKRIIPYILIGAVISALSAAFLPADVVERYVGNDSWYAIPVAATIGVPLYLRIEMAIPLLQVLIAKGMSMGAAMSLLIGGTGASLPEIAIISSVLKPKAVIAFVCTVILIAMAGGWFFITVS
ncbi:permease [Desulfoplanes formicivorans]|uniref:Membrane protein n=1 Tax=Desulfoplanes formicivorans TaxID=1592317 RepID=A0A194ADE5_9BACT|nr:permease [Desulfoplanes formicivorans]GAU07373.1 membrane protein [Desulfoplanes formicivorans]